jgi:hypothetical protein
MYQWYKGGIPISSQTNDVITFSNLTFTDAGTYVVVLANAFGSVTSAPATVTVLADPGYVDSAYALPYSGPGDTAGFSTFLATSTAPAITNLDAATKASLVDYLVFRDGLPRGLSGTDQNIQNLYQTDAAAVFSAIYGLPVTTRSNSIDQYMPLATIIDMGITPVPSLCQNCYFPQSGDSVCCNVGGDGCVDFIAEVGTNLYRVDVPFPVAYAGSSQTIVRGQTVSLGQAPAAGYAYSWSPAAGLSATNVANPTASPTVTTTYTLTVAASPEIAVSSTVTIVVTPPAAPVIGSAKLSGSSFSFSWSALSNQLYQIQATTSLAPARWTNLGGAIIASNTTMSTNVSIGTNSQQFYRLVLLP